jgi:OOP family OmpA-OmpF porin
MKDTRYGSILRLGADYNDYIGLEARVLKTFGSDIFSDTEHYGLYLKPQYHVADKVNIYGLIGYGKTSIDYTNGVRSSTTSESGLSYGAGFEYDLSSDTSLGQYSRMFDGQGEQEKGWGLWADFQRLLTDEGAFDTTSSVATFGVTYDF